MKEYFRTNFGILYQGDCLDLMRFFDDDSTEFVFADPPYNTNQPYDIYKDKRKDYKEWCKSWFLECRRISYRFIITPGLNNIFMWPEIEKPYGMGIWYKPNGTGFNCLGNQKFEPYFYWAKQPYNLVGGNSMIIANNDYKTRIGNFGAGIKKGDFHPCPKPEFFMRQLLLQLMKSTWTVFDPFAGTGTTLLVAEKLEMKWIGCELSENYCKLIKNRINEYYKIESFLKK